MLALHALARAPAGAFAPDDAEALGAVATDALEARDTSHATRQALQQVALMLLRTRAAEADGRLFEAGLALLRALAARAGTLRLPDLSRGLPRRAAPAVVAALAPHIAAANARERPELVLALAAALGARGHDLPELARLLEPLVDAKPDAVAARAIDLLLANPRGRDGRVRALLDRDPSAFVLPAVLRHVHRRRQDWLDPFLDGTPLAGRFLTGRTLYLPPLYEGFHRWLPRQQRAFARLARPAGRDPGQAQAARVLFIGQLARLPVSGVADFEPFLQSGEVPTIEAALGALAWLDEPAEALPVLLGHLEGDRARVATYALPRVARFVGGPALAPLLAGLAADPGRNITVRKEALRLLGERRDPASVPALERVLAQPKLPKDVAIAVGHAARNLLDDPRAFGLLERLARSPEPDVARSLLAPSPERLPASARPSYAAIVLALAWHPDASTRRAAATALAAWSVGQEDAIAARLAEIVVDLAGGDAWREAGATLAALAADGAGLDALGHALETLAGRARDPGPAPLERDRPALRRLHDLAQRLLDAPLDARLRLGPRLAGLADRLRDDDAWPLAAALRVAAI
ncbi:MAG TPA: HEAT repeat domain-containing protein, partial [Polyangiaceae bacterium]|nr:HEAT repeat domain-containing protein [Polyangiaceae bacterium]